MRSGDADGVLQILTAPADLEGTSTAHWLDIDVATASPASLEPVRNAVLRAQRPLAEAARVGDAAAALDALGKLRLLCAHREGPTGVATWNARAEQWLAEVDSGPPPDGGWYVGRPVIVTANDYGLGLFNGDTGVVVAHEGTDERGGRPASGLQARRRGGNGEPGSPGGGCHGLCHDGAQGPGVGVRRSGDVVARCIVSRLDAGAPVHGGDPSQTPRRPGRHGGSAAGGGEPADRTRLRAHLPPMGPRRLGGAGADSDLKVVSLPAVLSHEAGSI